MAEDVTPTPEETGKYFIRPVLHWSQGGVVLARHYEPRRAKTSYCRPGRRR